VIILVFFTAPFRYIVSITFFWYIVGKVCKGLNIMQSIFRYVIKLNCILIVCAGYVESKEIALCPLVKIKL
jgi:hypothetical protein